MDNEQLEKKIFDIMIKQQKTDNMIRDLKREVRILSYQQSNLRNHFRDIRLFYNGVYIE